MKNKRAIDVIIVFVFCLLLLFYAKKSADTLDNNYNVTELPCVPTDLITFEDPVIENAIRKIIGYPVKYITKEHVSTIMKLHISGVDGIETLEDLKWFDNLESLTLANCNLKTLDGIETLHSLERLDISGNPISNLEPISNLSNLRDLECSNCEISDISALADLKDLTFLNLESNQITSLDPIMPLAENLYQPNFNNNPIPEENWLAFFYPIEKNREITTINASIHSDMPEFTFVVYSYMEPEYEHHQVYKIEISDDEVFQTLTIPENTIFGQTCIGKYDNLETMGLTFEDLNFDGYLDLRLFDNYNGNYRKEWLYFVWNPETGLFEFDNSLRKISLASFDQENQLIYGMERDSAVNHYYSTYQYIDNEVVLIRYVTREGLMRSNEQIANYLSIAGVETGATEFSCLYHATDERNAETGEMEVTEEGFIIYATDGYNTYEEVLLCVDISSELGQIIATDKAKHN